MKKYLKSLFKGVAALFVAAGLFSCSNLLGDDSSSSSSSVRGAVSVSMFVPDYYASSSARVVATQTNSVRFGYKSDSDSSYTYLDSVELSSAEKTVVTTEAGLSGYTYKFTFEKVPVADYAADCLIVELLDSGSEVISSGTNSETVSVTEDASVAASFYTIPVSTDGTSGSLEANEMKFIKINLSADVDYNLNFTLAEGESTYPKLALFNSDGTFNKLLTVTDGKCSLDKVTAKTAYYVGIYSESAISSYTARFLNAGRIATTAATTAGTITMNGTTYDTIAAALAAIPTSGTTDTYAITLTPGTYEENALSYKGSATVKISGTGTAAYGTDVLIYGQGSNMNNEKLRSLLAIDGTGNIILENLTLQNSYGTKTGDAQAETLGFDSTGTVAAYNCSFLSGQDTLRTTGKAWFYKCYVEGDVDFLWMESSSGQVALYEECVLRAISSRTTKAYFTAPRMAVQNKVGKGLVVYNSELQTEDGLEVYLGRNPWAGSALSSYYNQVAFVGCDWNGESDLNSKIWYSTANGTSDQQYVGFKTDSNFSASSSNLGGILSDSVKSAEYAGRKNILNRIYLVGAQKFRKHVENVWDIDSVISTNGWTVTEDTSSELLDGETEPKIVTYDFTTEGSGAYAEDSGVTFSGFAHESGKTHAKGNAGSTISFAVDGNATISVSGFYSGYGSIKVGDQGEAIYDFNNGTTSTTVQKNYINYSGEGTVTITAGTPSYITQIVVEYDDSLTNTDVTGVEVSASSELEMVGVALTLSATVTPEDATNTDVLWSSSDESIATIDRYNGKVTFLAAGEVTFTATSCGNQSITATKTCNPTVSEWTAAEWFTTDNTLDAEDAACNSKYFSFASSSYKQFSSAVEFTNMAGTKISTQKGLKLNSSGKLVISTISPATLTVITSPVTNCTKTAPAVTNASGTKATTVSTDETDSLNTYVYHLDTGDTWTLQRSGSTENYPLVYAKVMYDAVWDWQNGSPASITSTNIQSTTGTVESNIEDVVLTVDATNNKGKLAYNSVGYAQFNAGTKIKVPVNAGSTVTVVSYSGQYSYTVAGVKATANTTTYTATKDGYCPIVATGTAFLYSISVTNVTADADHTESVVEFTATTETVTNDEDTLGLTATTATSADETIATAEVTTDGIVITSVAEGTTAVSAKDADSNEATITVTVSATGAVTTAVTKYTSSTSIDETTTINFGSSGNYKTVANFDISNASIRDNGDNNSQISSGYLQFDVKAGATVAISSYSGYTSYTFSDGTTTSDTQTGTSYSYAAESDCTITITTVNSQNYLYSITITYSE